MGSFVRKLRWLVERRGKEEQLAAELQFHLEEEARERLAAGMSQQEADWAAARHLGNLGAAMEDSRAAWGWTLLEQLCQDLRYGWRTMRRSRAFTILAALSLALGIGANTAIYSFMDAVLMRSLPVADPHSLVVLEWRLSGGKKVSDSVLHNISGSVYDDPQTGPTSRVFPYPAFELLRNSHDALSVLFAYRPARKLNLMIKGQAEVSGGEYVSGEFFQGLGVAP